MSLKRKKFFASNIVGETSISSVGQIRNELLYCGYSFADLLESHCSFEEVAFLLTRGRRPHQRTVQHQHQHDGEHDDELRLFCASLHAQCELSPQLRALLEQQVPKECHPIDVLKIAVAYMGILTPEDLNNINKRAQSDSVDNNHIISDGLIAALPSIVAYHYQFHFHHRRVQTRMRASATANVTEKSSNSIAGHFLRMLDPDSDASESDEFAFHCECLTRCLIMCAEHGLTTSAFAARVTVSSLSDIHSAVGAALGALKGRLHGGANMDAYRMLCTLPSAEYVRSTMLARKQIVPGFGHAAYSPQRLRIDPRSVVMKRMAVALCKRQKQQKQQRMNPNPNQSIAMEMEMQAMLGLAERVEDLMWQEKRLFSNVDFYGGLVYKQLGIPPRMFTAVLAFSLVVGWIAHIREQRQHNKLIRPTSIYIGKEKQALLTMKGKL